MRRTKGEDIDLIRTLSTHTDSATLHELLEQHENASPLKVVEEWRALASQYAFTGKEEKALQIADAIKQIGIDLQSEAISALGHWTYGNVYTILGLGEKALSHYQTAARHYKAAGERLNLARMQVGLVGTLNQMGDYKAACHVAEESWRVLASSGLDADLRRLAGLANNLGIAYEYLGRYEEALDLYEQKIVLWQNWPNDPSSDIEIARAHINLGVLKKRINLWGEARRDLEAGRQVLEKQCERDAYQLDLARAEMHLAHLQACQGAPYEQVSEAFTQARSRLNGSAELLTLALFEAEWELRTNRKAPSLRERLLALRQRCTEASSRREVIGVNLLLARHEAREGQTEAAVSGYTEAHEEARLTNDWEMVYRALHGLGQTYMQVNDLEKAREAFEKAVEAIELIRQDIISTSFRTGFLDDKLTVYQDLIALHLSRGELAQAFHWSERIRSRELVKVLGYRRPHPSKRIKFDAWARGDRLIEETVAPEEICNALPDDTLLLIYTIVRRELWVLALTTERCLKSHSFGAAPSPEKIEQSLSWLYNLSEYPGRLIKRHIEMLTASARAPLTQWYKQFLAPFEELLQTHQRIIIIPDGPLLRLPFHAFYNVRAGRHVIETHQVSYSPSATALLMDGPARTKEGEGVALSYAGQRLRHTQVETEAILRSYPNFAVYQGREANIHRLESEEARKATIIHLATHSVFRRDNPLFSYVDLEDGRLETVDILRLRLQAQLVVLSACETGRGLLRGGEYLGLGWAFLLAGTRSVLASHWPVDDAATAELMGNFYRSLADGLQPGAALQYAQRVTISTPRSQHRHPYYWAPFFLLETGSLRS